MADISGLFGGSAPQASAGLDPDFLAQLAAASQARQAALAQAGQAAGPAPQGPSGPQGQGMPGGMPQQQQDASGGMPGLPGGLPQVKPGPLDYVMSALFEHKSPMEVNRDANMANLGPQLQLMQFQNTLQALRDYQRTFGVGGGGQAPQGSPDASGGAQGPSQAPMGMIGAGAPSTASTPALGMNGGSFASVPTVGRVAPLLSILGLTNPKMADSLLDATVKSQPQYQIVNGRRVITNDPSGPQNIMPADGSGFTNVADPSAPGGFRTVPTPGYQGVATNQKVADGIAANLTNVPAPGLQANIGIGPDGSLIRTGTSDPGSGVRGYESGKAQDDAAATAMNTPHPITNADGTTDLTQNNYSLTHGGGPGGGVAPMPGAPNVGNLPRNFTHTGQTTAGAAEQTDSGKNAASSLNAYQRAAELARARLIQLQRAQQLNDAGQLGQGELNPTAMNIQNVLASFGGQNKNLPAQQQYAAVMGNLFKGGNIGAGTDANTTGAAGGTANVRNQREFTYMQSMYPQLQKTQKGRAAIIRNEIADAQRIAKIGDAATTWDSKFNGLSSRNHAGTTFEQQKNTFLNQNPLAQ